MKIFVTGGSGFIGTNFILNSLLANNKILNLDKLTYAGNPENLKSIEGSPNYQFVLGDICDFNIIFESISRFKPDAVLHFAAESHVDRSIDSPMTFNNTNIIGTASLLKATQLYYNQSNNNKFVMFVHCR